MIDVVVVYDRSAAGVLEHHVYENASPEAFARRLELERAYRTRGDVEVVLVSAGNFDDLKISHARYFDPTSIRAERLKQISESLLNRAS